MSMDNLAFESGHNHQHCIDQALQQARTLCKERQQRLTPVRELVLKLIWQSHQPIGAYELLPALAEAGFNSAPPTVYRALEFLQEQGFVHRIASLNAFVGCPHPEDKHQGYFLICRNCHSTSELESAPVHETLKQSAAELGFSIEQETIEVTGLCPNCRNREGSDA
ncbi:Fur family transcriptional regulator [Marinobacterium stanieri]|uniref:Ferric uptake regulation protein n=1 Tax=Marinobacterium stanieri TaxID=49186 RepID=A0A1N6WN33_9GAMM|nr:Fur family transcriptional regulator [Marinobacterium stanieri]SIQ91503.1 Fur family transcriptional regulator, zinc uptake regulator [Marinobacterium stanieri]